MRGDEPTWNDAATLWLAVFPACAGMNRIRCISRTLSSRVPRMRGDEPAQAERMASLRRCSPHARG